MGKLGLNSWRMQLSLSGYVWVDVVVTKFTERKSYLSLFKIGDNHSQIDFISSAKSDRKDCKVISGEVLTIPHGLMVLDVK